MNIPKFAAQTRKGRVTLEPEDDEGIVGAFETATNV
jgi:hypothetical protein